MRARLRVSCCRYLVANTVRAALVLDPHVSAGFVEVKSNGTCTRNCTATLVIQVNLAGAAAWPCLAEVLRMLTTWQQQNMAAANSPDQLVAGGVLQPAGKPDHPSSRCCSGALLPSASASQARPPKRTTPNAEASISWTTATCASHDQPDLH